jgi:hypothetical protein
MPSLNLQDAIAERTGHVKSVEQDMLLGIYAGRCRRCIAIGSRDRHLLAQKPKRDLLPKLVPMNSDISNSSAMSMS